MFRCGADGMIWVYMGLYEVIFKSDVALIELASQSLCSNKGFSQGKVAGALGVAFLI